MKKVILIALVLCLLFSCAYADMKEDFNSNTVVFGSLPLLDSMAKEKGEYTIYEVKGCKITFKGEERIFVQGEGTEFLAYSMAAILTFEPGKGNFKDNAGLLLAYYLLSRDGTQQTWTTPGGLLALIQPDEKEFIFAIGK